MSTQRRFSSSHIEVGARVTAAAIAAAGALTMQGCSNTPPDSNLYHSSAECVADKIYAPEFCEKSFAEAQKDDANPTVTYASAQDCNQDWDDDRQCQARTVNGHVVYAPHMSGYWVGYTGSTTDPKTRTGYGYAVYKSRDGGLVVPRTNQSFEDFGGTYTHPDMAAARAGSPGRPSIIARGGSAFSEGGAIARGGFGGEGHGFGGGE